MWCKFWQCRGAICPVLKTAEMSQAVGIGQDGRLWTAPTTGAALDPVDKTVAMTQPVGKDADGKLWTEPNVTPVSKTAAMTLPVGVDSDGHLFAEPPAGTDARVVSFVPLVSGGGVYFSIPAGYKIMLADLTFTYNGSRKVLSLCRIDDNVEQQNVNFYEKMTQNSATLTTTPNGGCVLDDDFSLSSYTGVYGVAVCVPN